MARYLSTSGGGDTPTWTKAIDVDFRALTPTTWTAADVGTEQDVDGYKFDLYNITGGDVMSVGDATLGLTGNARSATVAWLVSQGAQAIDLTGKNAVAIVAQVFEANPWSGQAGLQFGDAAAGSFNFGADALRTSSLAYQIARRTTGAAFTTSSVALPTAPGGWRTVLMVLGRSSVAMYSRDDIAVGTLPAPSDGQWGQPQRNGSAGINQLASGGDDWTDLTEAHLSLWHSNHLPAGSYYSLAAAAIYYAADVRS